MHMICGPQFKVTFTSVSGGRELKLFPGWWQLTQLASATAASAAVVSAHLLAFSCLFLRTLPLSSTSSSNNMLTLFHALLLLLYCCCAGVSMFIPAGTSLSFTGSSSTAALDAWITTANSRMFTSTPAPTPAGYTKAATAAAVTGDASGKTGAGTGGVVQVPSGGLEPGVGFTAAEQVAAAVMAGAAGSSCPVNAQDASAAAAAAAAAGGGQAAMETD
jgi:hypothetical protein